MDDPEVLKQELKEVIKQRDDLEEESKILRDFVSTEGDQLISPGPGGAPPPGLPGVPLVDSEGFPRSDIDVFDIRNKRQRLACIDTDHKKIMKRIEVLLPAVHAAARARRDHEEREGVPSSADSARAESVHDRAPPSASTETAIALIDEVSPDSPAASAGLQDIVGVVQSSVGRPIAIRISRSEDGTKDLSLTPRTWRGRGLLGCHLAPITK